MKTYKIETSGVVSEINGEYYGVQCRNPFEIGFGPIENAHIADPTQCRAPEHMAPHRSEDWYTLKGATLKKVTVVTEYTVEDK